jgi:hypothetical protein
MKRPKPPKPPTDRLGRRIPVNQMRDWDQAEDIGAQIHWLTKLRAEIKDTEPTLLAEVQVQQLNGSIEAVIRQLQLAVPYAVCPVCHGTMVAGCRICFARGWISKFRWDHIVPEESKRHATKTLPDAGK